MRPILVLLVLFVAAVASAQDLKETHGKTNAQILAMGFEKWEAFFTKAEGGETTVSMSDASVLYASALAWRNDNLARNLTVVRRAELKRLQELLDSFGGSVVEVGRALSGGGTMWNIIGAGVQVDAEEARYQVLKGSRPKHRVVSDVARELTRLKSVIDKTAAAGDYPDFDRKAALSSLQEARTAFDKIVAILKKRPRNESDAILGYCVDQLGKVRRF